jgi:hypothetical protein
MKLADEMAPAIPTARPTQEPFDNIKLRHEEIAGI